LFGQYVIRIEVKLWIMTFLIELSKKAKNIKKKYTYSQTVAEHLGSGGANYVSITDNSDYINIIAWHSYFYFTLIQINSKLFIIHLVQLT
jgi:hypothetical protein